MDATGEVLNFSTSSLRAWRNERFRSNLKLRSEFFHTARTYLRSQGFVEVDTAILRVAEDPTPTPLFVTLGSSGWPRIHLRTTPEQYTRRAVLPFGKVFEVAKCFRNEWARPNHGLLCHLPEFTQLQIWEADANLETSLNSIENFIRDVVTSLVGSPAMSYDNTIIDFSKPFEHIKILDALEKYAGDAAKDFVSFHRNAQPNYISGAREEMKRFLDGLVKPKIIQPTFLTHFPSSLGRHCS